MYKDKESFVTSAYKKKLEELRKLEEEEKYEEYLESVGDVKKQGNLDGFYRHLYEQKVKYEDKDNEDIKKEIKEEVESVAEDDTTSEPQEQLPGPSRKRSLDRSEDEVKTNFNKDVKKRRYRTRRNSNDSDNDDNDNNDVRKEHLPSNIDADSDFSIDSSDSEDEEENNAQPAEEKNNPNDQPSSNVEPNTEVKTEISETVKSEKSEVETETPEVKVAVKPKIDIWKKRTVGDKFNEAVKRYFERKAQREMSL